MPIAYFDNAEILTDVTDLFLTQDAASNIVGIPPETFNTIQEITEAMSNDANFFQTTDNKINLKRNISDSYDKTYIITSLDNIVKLSTFNDAV